MFDRALPTHGYLPVAAVFWAYVVAAFVVTFLLGVLGLPERWELAAFVVVCLLLLKPFVPLFRRYSPRGAHER